MSQTDVREMTMAEINKIRWYANAVITQLYVQKDAQPKETEHLVHERVVDLWKSVRTCSDVMQGRVRPMFCVLTRRLREAAEAELWKKVIALIQVRASIDAQFDEAAFKANIKKIFELDILMLRDVRGWDSSMGIICRGTANKQRDGGLVGSGYPQKWMVGVENVEADLRTTASRPHRTHCGATVWRYILAHAVSPGKSKPMRTGR
jgi:hypothetical protein